MSETMQDRTEAPTPKRRQEAARRGEVPRSTEVTTAAVLLAGAFALNTLGRNLAGGTVDVLHYSSSFASTRAPHLADFNTYIQQVGRTILLAGMPLLAAIAAVSVTVNAVQARGVLSTETLKPKWERLDPAKNLKRLFSMRSTVELLKSLLKLLVVGFVLYIGMRRAWPDIMAATQQSPYALVRVMVDHSVRLLMTAGIAYLALAGADYAWQLWSFEKQLRMTKQEVKQELKENEGDPLVKSRLRSLGRQMTRRKMFRDVAIADVVVTNPTHIAVALKYDTSVAAAPIILAMGQRKVAQRIKRLAIEAGVPVIENKPLARALFATARVGLPIPVDLYVAVAEVLAFVMRRRAADARRWTGSETA